MVRRKIPKMLCPHFLLFYFIMDQLSSGVIEYWLIREIFTFLTVDFFPELFVTIINSHFTDLTGTPRAHLASILLLRSSNSRLQILIGSNIEVRVLDMLK
ncbi:hypothetical protein NGRA_3073 [Nosema granulosis]|uniref:Uncharacterized protein n=1 Tax=Nosema granulosis TaxID=83296 RepID=A0A9P6KXI6_9MICR|nr:hypothetical protein NGRA_3073 [Nosema granulosis]